MRMPTVTALALAAVFVAAPPFARAADDRAIQEARARFQAGVQLFHEGSFDAALAEFRKAHQLAPSFRVLYNIAQVQLELHDSVSALRTFRQYLEEGGAEVPSDRRAQVEGEIQKLERRVAVVDVVTNVDGADVLVDDVPVATSPLQAPLLVNAGQRRITVAKTGRVATARALPVAGGERVKVRIDLPLAVAPRPNPFAAPPPAPVAADKPRTKMWIALATTAALAIGTGTFALLTHQARKDFETQLDTFPTTSEDVDRARRRMVVNAAVTDGLAGATLLAGGLTVYFAITHRNDEPEPETKTRRAHIRVVPTLGGLAVCGQF